MLEVAGDLKSRLLEEADERSYSRNDPLQRNRACRNQTKENQHELHC